MQKYVWETTHWMRNTRIYKIWLGITQRCNNKKNPSYINYWRRGIKCERNNFEEFYKDMWDSYEDLLTIERIDVNWNYCKANCKRIPMEEQYYNRTDSRRIEYKWERMSLWKLCKMLWLNYSLIKERLNSWLSIDEAISKIKRIDSRICTYKWKEWKIIDLVRNKWLNINTVNARLRYWYTIEEAIDLWCQKEKKIKYNWVIYNSMIELAKNIWINIRTLHRHIKSWKKTLEFL